MHRSRALSCAVGLMAGIWLIAGCTPEPIQVGFQTDIAPCLLGLPPVGADDDGIRSTCRDNLDTLIASGTVNACLLVRGGAGDGADQRIPMSWDGRTLTNPLDTAIDLAGGERFDAALFFLTEADDNGGVCNALTLDTGCGSEPLCALKLIDAGVIFADDGSTVLDFTDNSGQCVSENGPAFASEGGGAERCDDMDNDCDRRVDEDFETKGQPCESFAVGMDASSAPAECRATGSLRCDESGTGVVCGAEAPATADEESCGERAGLDDDCDGRVDEGTDCFVCAADDDCEAHPRGTQCVERRCVACDPLDHAGCTAAQLCCGQGLDAACVDTGLNDRCTGCDDPLCTDDRADACLDRTCVCGDSPACADPTPHCVGGECRQCLINGFAGGHGDCEDDALCCGPGDCLPTGAGPGEQCEGCGEPCDQLATDSCIDRQCQCGVNEPCSGGTPACDRATSQCVECIADAQCGGVRGVCEVVRRICVQCLDDDQCGGAQPECVGNACVECDAGADDEQYRCDEDGPTPICDGRACSPCEADIECAARPGDRDFCVDGECWACRPDADNSGCGDPALPICDTETGTCRGCAVVDECNTDPDLVDLNTRECAPDGRCVGCVPDPADGPPNLGCSPTGPTPVCGDGDVCRGCAADAECPAQAPLADEGDAEALTVCLDGSCRECRPRTDEAPQAGCQPEGPTPHCSRGNCVPCETDRQCAAIPGAAPICADGRCRECDPSDTSRGCGEVAASICDAATFTCRACEANAECPDGADGAEGLCVDGICTGCDVTTNEGCDVAGDRPVCVDPDGDGVAFCAPCDSDAACEGIGPGARGQCLANGRCAACDPTDNAGCDALSPLPACRADDAGELACRACDSDRPCEDFAEGRPLCVSDGSCQACDPVGDGAFDDRGCAHPTAVCDLFALTCRGCEVDGECTGDLLCRVSQGVCTECVPEEQVGCDLTGPTPFCDGETARCRACTVDAECAGNPQGEQCIEGRCQGCDPSTHAGCDPVGAAPFCARDAAGVFNCRGCGSDAECGVVAPELPQCIAGTCRLCDPAGDGTADDVGCARPTAVCDGDSFECRGCANDDECPGELLCRPDGTCDACVPETGAGCDTNGFTPVCDAGSATCRGCDDDAECAGHPQGEQCVAGRCQACDPSDHGGCDTGALCCGDGLPACEATSVDSCTGCGVACGETADACVDRACRCGDEAACAFPLAYCAGDGDGGSVCLECFVDEDCGVAGRGQCVDGFCEECDAENGLGAPGCVREALPFCDPDLNGCRSCADDDSRCLEYGAHPQCVGDGCFECDPRAGAGYAGCDDTTAAPVCDTDDKACRACGSDAECAAEYDALGQCVGDFCRVCDPDDFAGCGAQALCCLDGEDEGEGIPECRATDLDIECEACGEPCDRETADNCTDRACQCGEEPACNGATPYCVGSDCVECRVDEECPGEGTICVNNACRACDPVDNRNCPDGSDTPVCDADSFTCRGCGANAECDDEQPGQVCLDSGACRVCDPASAIHEGCAADELCCDRDGAPGCFATGYEPGQECEACGEACELDAADACTERDCACGDGEACGGDTPYCVGGACVECRADAECADSDVGPFCLGNVCRACDPADNEGCVAESDAPFCDAETFTCRGCGDNDECVGNPNGATCLQATGLCRVCNPAGHDGCEDDELCCDRDGAPGCFGTGHTPDAECESCGQACAEDAADACADRACVCGAGAACEGDTPYCADGSCVECRDDAECADSDVGPFCLGNVCRACNPADNDGCDPASDAPFCDPATFSCRRCNDNDECAGNPSGPVCQPLSGACVVCNPVDHDGCGDDELCCDDGDGAACAPTAADGQCEACGVACDANGANGCGGRDCLCGDIAACDPEGETPYCDGAACRACTNDAHCAAGEQCLGFECRACNPDDNSGCADDSETPICDRGTFTCRGCNDQRANECAGNANGAVCTGTGACRRCDVADHDTCEANELCCDGDGEADCQPADEGACFACDGACDAAVADTCVDRACVCGETGAPCGDGAAPFCQAGACVGCRDDGDCPDGVCDTDTDVCVECLDNGDCTNEVCDVDNNVCVECLDDGDCTDELCDTDNNVCVECLADDDCPDGVCGEGGACIECREAADCADTPETPFCAGKTCVECLDNGDCPILNSCVNNACNGL